MFRCLDCRTLFKEPLELKERHGLDTPPFESRYYCPKCKGSSYKPLIRDAISRREVLDSLVGIMQALNEFEYAFCDVFSGSALDGTKFDTAHSDLFELMISIAGDSEFELPGDIDDKLFDMKSSVQAAAVYEILTTNIEE